MSFFSRTCLQHKTGAKGFNMFGDPVEISGTNLLARAIQHETDHLDGILFIDRLDAALRKEAMKEIRLAEWFGHAVAEGVDLKIKISPHSTFGLGL
jgi:peptide deformylase